MNIAYVVPRYAPHTGGLESHVCALARRVTAMGHTVEVLTAEVERDAPQVESIEGVAVRRFPVAVPSEAYPVACGLYTHLRRHAGSYDLIHAHSYHALPALAAAFASRPLVFTPHYHGTGHTALARLAHVPYRLLGGRVFARADRIICVSGAEAALVRRHFPGTEARLTVIPNGVESALIRAARPYPTRHSVLLSVGRLEPYKRVDALLRAMPHLDEHFRLVVIGEGSQRAELESLAGELGVEHRTSFLGRVDDDSLRRWYRTAAVCVALSEHEAYGLTLAEAAVAGARIVASAIPAHAEVVRSLGSAAALIPPATSTEDIAAAIATAAGLRSVEGDVTVLDWDEVAARTVRVYQDILAPPFIRAFRGRNGTAGTQPPRAAV